MIKAIFAIDQNGGIGKDNGLPWPHHKSDMLHFKNTTMSHVVVMGRNTWESVGFRKPLPNRVNVVVSSSDTNADITIKSDICNNIRLLQQQFPEKDIFIIGGAKLLVYTLEILDELIITEFEDAFDCDCFLPIETITQNFKLKNQTQIERGKITIYERL